MRMLYLLGHYEDGSRWESRDLRKALVPALALARFNSPAAYEALLAALGRKEIREDWQIRRFAAQALGMPESSVRFAHEARRKDKTPNKTQRMRHSPCGDSHDNTSLARIG